MLNRKPMTVIITNAAEGGTSGSMFVTQLRWKMMVQCPHMKRLIYCVAFTFKHFRSHPHKNKFCWPLIHWIIFVSWRKQNYILKKLLMFPTLHQYTRQFASQSFHSHILRYKTNEICCLWSSLYECVSGLKVNLNVSEANIEHCN